MQAVVVGAIREVFPEDQVVAEETSTVLKKDPEALEAVSCSKEPSKACQRWGISFVVCG